MNLSGAPVDAATSWRRLPRTPIAGRRTNGARIIDTAVVREEAVSLRGSRRREL
jgi:hypothetical protein